jgi:TetR/AcrR family transcriptional repressor of nem operon
MATRGYAAVGVSEVCREAGVQKGSFYHFYDSKQTLTLAVIDAHWDVQRLAWQALLTGPQPPLDRLQRLLEAQAEAQQASQATAGAVSGCLLANLALELSTQDETVTARLSDVFDEQIGRVHAVLQEAAAEGSVTQEAATRESARAVVAQLEGMVLFAKMGNDPSVLDQLWPQVRRLLHA